MNEEEKQILEERYPKALDIIGDLKEQLMKVKYELEEEIEYNRGLREELEKEKDDNIILALDLQKAENENKQLKDDIKGMINFEAVVNILIDNFDITKDEAKQILGEE